ncbi:MAG: ABC transporter permease [Alphaproteobacteria bacterium]
MPETQLAGPTAAAASPSTLDRRLRAVFAQPWSGVAMLLFFYIVLFVAFTVLSPFFLSFNNLMRVGSNMAFIGLMAAAGTPLIVAGGLDLSVAAVAGLTGVVIALLHGAGVDIWLAVALAVMLGGAIGAGNGALATGLRLNPLIVTLGTMGIITGLAMVLTGGGTRPLLVDGFNWIGGGGAAGKLLGVPVPLYIMMAFILLVWFIMAFTRFGRFIYASGGNAEASRLLGVPVARTQILLYVFSGISGALAGTVLAAMLGAAAPDAAGDYLLTVIAAIILGGTSLFGGRGSVWGTLLAVLILGTLNNGLTLLDVSSFWQEVTRGVVLLLAVGLDQVRTRAMGE